MARLVKLGLWTVALAVAALTPAGAQQLVCLDLQSQYVALLRASEAANSGQAMLDMDRVSRELAEAQAAARQGNCNRFLFLGPRASPQCPAINAAVDRLRREVAQMRGQRGFFLRSPESERARLRDWLMQYGCDVPELGGVRTVCVRRCDGYFFPISFSTSREQFGKDAATCQSMYVKEGEAELHAYNMRDDVANAVSMSGQRYGDQSYAFLYRDHFSPICASQLKEGIAALGERYWSRNPRRARAAFPIEAVVAVPMPNLRPLDRQEDPETIANRNGRLPVAPYVGEDEPTAAIVAAGAVRRVGDPYYAELFDLGGEPPRHRPPLGFDLIGAAMAMEADQAAAAP